jgi:tRNA(Ile)-lysidine synthase
MRGAHPERALEGHVAERVNARAGEMLLAAVSGGADSVAMAALLSAHAARTDATLILAHVNHQTRSSSEQDEAVVLSAGAALRARVVTRLLPEGSRDEARLREERYAALSAMAREVGARRVFTAHHARDQTETVLLALFRGAGPEALRGMQAQRALDGDLTLERPLLRVSREELTAYCALLHLPVVFDASNLDERYKRNALRSALAELRESFPHLDEAVARCAEIASDEAEQTKRARLRAFVRERLREELPPGSALRDVSFNRLDAVARALEGGRAGRHFLKPGVHAELHGDACLTADAALDAGAAGETR